MLTEKVGGAGEVTRDPSCSMPVHILPYLTRYAQWHLAKSEDPAHAPAMPSDWAPRSKADAIAVYHMSTSRPLAGMRRHTRHGFHSRL